MRLLAHEETHPTLIEFRTPAMATAMVKMHYLGGLIVSANEALCHSMAPLLPHHSGTAPSGGDQNYNHTLEVEIDYMYI